MFLPSFITSARSWRRVSSRAVGAVLSDFSLEQLLLKPMIITFDAVSFSQDRQCFSLDTCSIISFFFNGPV